MVIGRRKVVLDEISERIDDIQPYRELKGRTEEEEEEDQRTRTKHSHDLIRIPDPPEPHCCGETKEYEACQEARSFFPLDAF